MTESIRNRIIVPWDFSQESLTQLLHAYQLAQVRGDDILLLAAIKRPGLFGSKKKFDKLRQELMSRVQKDAERHNEKFKQENAAVSSETPKEFREVTIYGDIIVYRNLRTDFRKYYFAQKSNLVVTSQFLTLDGKKTINMIRFLSRVKSSMREGIPFIVVNKPPSHKYYKELILPVSSSRTFKETVRWIIQIAGYYNCNVNMIRPSAVNDSLQKFNMSTNISFAKKYFSQYDIVYGLRTATRKVKFEDSVFEFIRMLEADLLVLMSDQLLTYFPSKKIDIDTPVMFINPILKKTQSFN